ncbi:MAG: CAP domain-containing protein [Sphingomonadales bacterium]|nr:MAG: CAP domain-containing protein [Sphingomonadales bacterium]
MILRCFVAAASALLAIAPAHANDAAEGRRVLQGEVLAQINFARQHPREYAEQLRDYREHFHGRILFLPGDQEGVYTHEGVDAVDEAIDFLERQAPLPALSAGEMLMLAARDHAEDRGDAGATGHVSGDGMGPGDRVRRRGGDIYVGESIYYGANRADQVVRSLIVDDGVAGRGHRTLLFTAGYRYAGVGCAEHRRFDHICVVDLAATENGAPELPAWAQARGAQLFRMPDARGKLASAEAE